VFGFHGEEVVEAAGRGLGGGTSITAKTLTFGRSDKLGWTDSSQYQGGAYTGTRVLATTGRELLVTAAGLKLAAVAGQSARLAVAGDRLRKARALQFIASGATANAAATTFSLGIGLGKQAFTDAPWEADSLALSKGGRVGSFLGGGVGSVFTNAYWAGGLGGAAYSTSQQLIDVGIEGFSLEELGTDIVLSMVFAKLASSSGNKKLKPKQRVAVERWGEGKSLSPNQKRVVARLLHAIRADFGRAFGIGAAGEFADEVVKPAPAPQ